MIKSDMNLDDLKRAVLKKKLKEQLQTQQHQKRPPVQHADRDLPLPLSFAQQRLWFLHQLEPATSLAYHIPMSLRLTGQLNHHALTAALNLLVARHEILRTRFMLTEGQPYQHIDPADTGFTLTYQDLRTLDSETHMQHIADIAALEARTPFDLTQGPLIRGQLLQLADDDHVLLFTQHHIIFDGWSIGVLAHELSALYRIECDPDNNDSDNNSDTSLPPLPIQYADYALWQRNWLQGDVLAEQRDFWSRQLKGAPALLSLPTDRPRPASPGYTAGQVPIQFDASLSEALKLFGQRHQATLFMMLLAGWSIVLSRMSGQDDIVIGTPVANRPGNELESLIGFFVNTLALRVTFSESPTVAELLTQIRERSLAAYAHQELPFEQVVEIVQPERSLSYNPIFQVMLALNNTPAKTLTLPGLQLTPVEQVRYSTHFDLTLSLTETKAGLLGELEYATDLFDAATIERMIGYLKQVLMAMTTDAIQPVARLPMLSASEQQQLLVEFNATQTFQTENPQNALIHTLFEAQAEQHPDTTAIIHGDQVISYAELNQYANRLAHHLIALGVRPDDRVAICVDRGLEMVVGLLAILKAGGAYVPLDPTYPAERLVYMLKDSAPVALLVQPSTCQAIHSDTVPAIMLDIQTPFMEEQPKHNPEIPSITDQHLAYIVYTSGSTGVPKGVMSSHHALGNRLSWFIRDIVTFPLITALKTSISFVDSITETLSTLLAGGRLVVFDNHEVKDPARFCAGLEHYGVNSLVVVPSFLQLLIRDRNEHALKSVRILICSGERLAPELARQVVTNYPWLRLFNFYGSAEINGDTTWYEYDAARGVPDVSVIGRPIANTRCYILNPDRQLVPSGVTGEIYIAGAGVARGYLNRPELTAERFLADPFSPAPNARMYKTGDLGRWLSDGNIEYLGRNDFQVKIRGFRIEPGEIETQLMQCDGVREAVVIAHEGGYAEKTGSQKQLVAYLLAQDGIELTPAQLRQQLAQHLADYMLPNAFVILDAFPLTPNGKLDRQGLPAPDQSAVITRSYEAPTGEMEIALARIWQTLLGLEKVGRHDHFFELGGHSLMIVNMIDQLHNIGLRLDVRNVFATPILSELAQAILVYQRDTPAFVVPPNLITTDCTAITPDMLPLVSLSQSEIDAIAATIPDGVSNIQDIYPLAPLQEGVLFHHLLQTQGDDYLLQSLLAFDSRERLDTFLAALHHIIDRHDILRTSAYWQDLAQPVQVVWRRAPLHIHHFIPTTENEVLSQLSAHTDPHHNRLNLNLAPLFSADIAYDAAQDEWLLSLRFHHLVSDHMTLELIFAEIAQVLQGQAESLPVALPYRDFIARILNVPVSVHEDYFRTRLADFTEPTAPFGIIRIPNDNRVIHQSHLSVDPALAKHVRTQARHLGVSPSVLFHVAWAQVLAHTSGHDDVVFGSVLLGRLQGISGVKRILGMFINTLPVRISLTDRNLQKTASVQEVVQATYRNLTHLLEHEQAPLSLAQQCSGVAQPMPLFSALLNYRHSQSNETETVSTTWEGIRVLAAEEQTNYPVTLTVDDLGEDFQLKAQTVTGINADRILQYLLTAVSSLADALSHNPQQPILPLPVIPASEQQQLLLDFNQTQALFLPTDSPQSGLIHQRFETKALHHPDDIAVVHGQQSLSYDELNRHANRLAHHLISLGVRPDDRVAICVERGLEMVVGLLAILKAGGAYVPLDPAYPSERLVYMLKDSAPVALLVQLSTCQVIHSDILPKSAGSLPKVLLDIQTPFMEEQPEHNPEISGMTDQHLAYVVYTSGSTGVPKGVMNSHHALSNRLLWFVDDIATFPLITALKTSISFVDSITETLGTLLAGGRLVVFDNHMVKDPARLCAGLQHAEVNLLVVVPSLLKLLIQDSHEHTLKSVRILICSGERLAPELAQQVVTNYPWLRLFNFYGSSEINGDATWYEYDAGRGVPDVSVIGRPIANTRCYILNPDRQLVPFGVTGEIYIAGAGLARGYLNLPELTAERFLPDLFSSQPNELMYKTGDLGRWLPDGNIQYLGRNDFQVKLRGFRIELGEIEAQLLQCHGVREAVVLVREDEPNQQRLVAYLRSHEGAVLIPAELRQQLSLHLAEYMLPGAFVTLETFPLTPNGKLDRKAFPAPDSTAMVTQNYVAPVGETEIVLAQIWQELLGLERVGRYDHFFELGGHSLLAVQLAGRIRQMLGRELPIQKIFDQPVLVALAHTLADAATTTQVIIPSADSNQLLPLSFAQQRLWFLGQLDPAASLAYHLPAALRLTGLLNRQALTSTLNHLIARHESLRTRFISIDGHPYQHIDPAGMGFSLPCHDLRQLDPALQRSRVAELVDLEARTPFDFAQGSLIRGQLIQLADDEHILLLTLHHIITDGWSLGILVRELGDFYLSALDGSDNPLLPLPIQYTDYAVWQRDQQQQVALNAQRDFWCRQLADIPALLTLPTDYPRPAVQTYAGGQVPLHLDIRLLTSLKELGQRHSTTLFMTLLSAWSIVLARLSGQDDIVIGTPVANRPHKELEGLIGFFANTLALRVKFSRELKVTDLLAQVREQSLAAYANQNLPFEQIVEALQPERSLSYSPIFQVMLTLNNTPPQKLVLPGLQLSSVEQSHHGAYFDLTLSLTETESGLAGALIYAADLFDHTTAERMTGYFTNILAAMVSNENRTVATLPIISEQEKRQLLVDFNATQVSYPQNALIHPLVEIQAEQYPDAIAVEFEDQTLSYGELNRRANQLAHYLVTQGVRPDTRVAIYLERSPEMVVGLLAILKAGGAYVPLDPTYPAERLAYMLQDSAPLVLLTHTVLLTRTALAETLNPAPSCTIVLLDEPQSYLAGQPDHNPDTQSMGLKPHHLAYVIYTSGSTGLPKGVEMPLMALSNLLQWQRQADSCLSRNGKTLQFAALGFDVAFQEIFTTLSEGGCLVLIDETLRREPLQLLRLIQQKQINRIFLPFIALQHLAEADSHRAGNSHESDISCLAHIITAGEQLRITPTIQRFLQRAGHCRLHNHYGPTESHVVTSYTLDKEIEHWPVLPPIGRPIANDQIYILDEYCRPVPLGVAGELYITGISIARGYLNRPELTAERFLINPFSTEPHARMYKTGDLARWLPDGNIEYLNRNDFQVKIRGFRIELGEVEAQLMLCHGVREAVVIAREEVENNQKRLVAYLCPQEGVSLSPAELRQQLARHLAEYMLPMAFVILDKLPLTPNGKLDRKALPAPDSSAIATRDYVAPVGETETVLAKIWQELLGLEQVGRYDHFFELGGHSLLAVRLAARVRQMLKRELPLQQLFSQPVLMDLAQAIAEADTTNQTMIAVADRSQRLPLSFAQQRLWFLGQLDPAASLAYHLPAALRLTGRLHHQALCSALDNLVARHEGLRTRFVSNENQPYQHIDAADIGFDLSSHDLRLLDTDEKNQRVAEIAEREAQMPFDFACGPLIRGQLLQLADEEHILLITLHHIITDGWSIGILVRELGVFYRAALNGQTAVLPPLPIQYADYAVWQHQLLQETVLAEQRDFWRKQLKDAPVLLTLPTDRPRPKVQTYVGSQVAFHLDNRVLSSLKTLGKRHNTTLFMTVLAGWGIVLARLSGQDDIVIGTPVAGRPYPELEGLMGFFVNTLALRIQFDEKLNVADLLAQVRESALAAFAHQELPFEQVVEALQPERRLSYSPVFQVMLALNNTPAQQLILPELQFTPLEQTQHTTHFDLMLSLVETESGLAGALSYATDLFDHSTIERMVGYFTNILTAMAADEKQAVMTLPMLPELEQQQLLVDFNTTQATFFQTDNPQGGLIHKLFEAQAEQFPDAIAVVFDDQAISYSELNRRANRLAHYLIASGVRPDDRVAVCLERGPEMVAGLLGILKAGGAYVPLDPAYPAERLKYMLKNSAPIALLTQSEIYQTISLDILCDLESADTLPIILLDIQTPFMDTQPEHNPTVSGITDQHLAYVVYTSGSTGVPKGVMSSHQALSNRLLWFVNDIVTLPLITALKTSISFIDSITETLSTLLAGGRLVVFDNHEVKDPARFLANLQHTGVNLLVIVPSLLKILIQNNDEHILKSIRILICSGEQLTPELARQLVTNYPWIRLLNFYGSSEINGDATWYEYDAARVVPDVSIIGRPIANTRCYILNPDKQLIPVGVIGEIYIAGAGLARGYLNQPDLTAERFLPDPFSANPNERMYKTGDLGRWLPDGNIEYLGRNDFQVKLRGFRIELGEIETRLAKCDGVREAVVIIRENPVDEQTGGQKRLVAYLLPHMGAKLVPAELRRQLAQHLAEYMLPSAFVTLEAFPLTPNGKLDRQALPAPDLSAMIVHNYAAPMGETEIALAQIWQDLLGLKRVGRYDHFFKLGGHSLLAIQLLNRMKEQEMEAPLTALFAHPTLCELATAVDKHLAVPESPFDANPVPLSPSGSLPPLFLIHETSGDPLVYSPLATLLPAELPVYALQALGIHTLKQQPTSIEELAACHIQAIRRIQPQGPYRLAGWSIGGLIAYEIAQQLINDNEVVEFLGMIDTYNYVNDDTDNNTLNEDRESEDKTAVQIGLIIDSLRTQKNIDDEQALEALYKLSSLEQVIDYCIEHQWVPANITQNDILTRTHTAELITRLGQDYVPPKSSLPVHLYAADESNNRDRWHGWHDIAGHHSVLCPIGGTHFSIMQPPFLNQIADSITEQIQAVPAFDPRVIIQLGSKSVSPLFCLPGAGASPSSLLELALSFPSQLPIYALQARGFTAEHNYPHTSVEGAARAYIRTIREIQPHGPYHLLGHSFGGWIAFEIALQLQAEGEQVADLILVDTDEPNQQGSIHKPVSHTETIMELIDIYDMILDQPLSLTRQDFENLTQNEQHQLLHNALIKAGLFPAKTSVSLLQGIIRVMQANLNTRYIPRTRYEGLVHLINAEDENPDEIKNRETQWRTHVAELDAMPVSGNHMTMLSTPSTKLWVGKLWQKLANTIR
ncbi:non-ribosomal peptide synthetase [Xenorhabdus sp. KJ12.1]|uniref:non-ribosomal peptide synthetase n=1 Tax=Xenorhabdus sp. KJ12.1 TaxID=1851571 RepID=UPI000C051D35|nr:non-ribosomal peptide synthetase [Xenorhabdus sp. KJ12.1]PHM72994.1 Amino acid adenylation [Xenorhabdus sp. KJ12.1]